MEGCSHIQNVVYEQRFANWLFITKDRAHIGEVFIEFMEDVYLENCMVFKKSLSNFHFFMAFLKYLLIVPLWWLNPEGLQECNIMSMNAITFICLALEVLSSVSDFCVILSVSLRIYQKFIPELLHKKP